MISLLGSHLLARSLSCHPSYLRRTGERVERLAGAAKTHTPEFSKIIHQSSLVAEQIALARRMAAYEVPVLVLGETGTGKELFPEHDLAFHNEVENAGHLAVQSADCSATHQLHAARQLPAHPE